MNPYNIDLNLRYEGYIWYSNKDMPDVYEQECIDFDVNTISNPFIIEGHLYNKDNNVSISIKFVDGRYVINTFDLKERESLEKSELKYVPNRMEGIRYLHFSQYWRPVPDEMCNGMEVLQPAELVFTGFSKN